MGHWWRWAFILLGSTVLIVPETQQGSDRPLRPAPVRIINSWRAEGAFLARPVGLAVRIPFAEQIVWIDKRIQSVEMERQQVLSTDQLRLQ